MRPLILLFSCFIIVVVSSCNKNNGMRLSKGSKAVTLRENLTAGQLFTLDLSRYGDEDDLATITQQGVNYVISEIKGSSASSPYIYNYQAAGSVKTNSALTDTVVLKVYEPAGRPHYDETIITNYFSVQ